MFPASEACYPIIDVFCFEPGVLQVPPSARMRAISLFTGVAGLELGLRQCC